MCPLEFFGFLPCWSSSAEPAALRISPISPSYNCFMGDQKMDNGIDWSLTTWEGSRRQQHLDFAALPFRRKLEVIEELAELAAIFAEARRDPGMPSIGNDAETPRTS